MLRGRKPLATPESEVIKSFSLFSSCKQTQEVVVRVRQTVIQGTYLKILSVLDTWSSPEVLCELLANPVKLSAS